VILSVVFYFVITTIPVNWEGFHSNNKYDKINPNLKTALKLPANWFHEKFDSIGVCTKLKDVLPYFLHRKYVDVYVTIKYVTLSITINDIYLKCGNEKEGGRKTCMNLQKYFPYLVMKDSSAYSTSPIKIW
jgi:DNA-binding XRE family transcriptional regulator